MRVGLVPPAFALVAFVALAPIALFASAAFPLLPAPSLEGWITDPQGGPVTDATVAAVPSGAANQTPLRTATDGTGHYELGLPGGGTYDIVVTHRLRSPWAGNVTVGAAEVWVLNVSLVRDTEPPVPVVTGPTHAPQDAATFLSAEASTDNAGISRYFWRFTDGELQAFVTPNISWQFSSLGPVPVLLTVTDFANNSASTTFVVQVTDGRPPLVSAGANRTERMDRKIEIVGWAQDEVDPPANLTFQWTVLGPFGPETTSGATLKRAFNVSTDWTLVLTVTDRAGNNGTDTAVVSVTPRNVRPAILPVDNRTVRAGDRIAFRVLATDADNDILSFALAAGPPGLQLDGGAGIVAWTPSGNQTGLHFVTAEVTDGMDTVNRTFSITVLPAITDLVIRVGPITDERGRPLAGNRSTVVVHHGSDERTGHPDEDGVAHVTVPVAWIGERVEVVASARGHTSVRFGGTILSDGTFVADSPPPYLREGSPPPSREGTIGLVVAVMAGLGVAAALLFRRKPDPPRPTESKRSARPDDDE